MRMKDSYYYRSLITSMLLYCIAFAGIVYAVYRTGMTGFLVLGITIAVLLCYFYGVFGNIRGSKERK